MNGNDITRILQDKNLKEAVARSERQLPEMPAELNKRLETYINKQYRASRRSLYWAIAAVCMAVIAFGSLMRSRKVVSNPADEPTETAVATTMEEVLPMPEAIHKESLSMEQPAVGQHITDADETIRAQTPTLDNTKMHNPLTPEQMDKFVAQMAQGFDVEGVEMNYDEAEGPSFTVYVLPDNPDILDRLFQLVSLYEPHPDKDLLAFSDEQFYLEITTIVNRIEVRNVWLAERAQNRVCLFRTKYTDDNIPSPDCLPFL